MTLYFTTFHRVLAQLEKALVRAEADPRDEELRDAVIQRFEYSYETAWKWQRHLAEEGVATIATFTRRDLYREAARRGIIAEPDVWFAPVARRLLFGHLLPKNTRRSDGFACAFSTR